MRVYVDSSALIKRSVAEAESDAVDDALSGIAERPMTADVVSLARRIEPSVLRSLDALHLATAMLVDANVVITYDERLAAAARHINLAVSAPAADAVSDDVRAFDEFL